MRRLGQLPGTHADVPAAHCCMLTPPGWLHLFREKDGGTEVALRVAYMLPEQLREYVGPVGVWGDVNDILEENLAAMKVGI